MAKWNWKPRSGQGIFVHPAPTSTAPLTYQNTLAYSAHPLQFSASSDGAL